MNLKRTTSKKRLPYSLFPLPETKICRIGGTMPDFSTGFGFRLWKFPGIQMYGIEDGDPSLEMGMSNHSGHYPFSGSESELGGYFVIKPFIHIGLGKSCA